MKRSTAASLGRQTLTILEAGHYTAPSGRVVEIAESLAQAREGTRTYRPDTPLPLPPFPDRPTLYEVVNESTLQAGRRLLGEGLRPAALNFASAKNPGGGFLNGALAQEESLARSSGLYACIGLNPMYEFHRGHRDCLYTSWVIYSPDVPVLRTDDGTLLETPYPLSFLTSPAPNAGVVLERDSRRRGEIRAALVERIARVLGVAALHGHEALVLGAWGCGAFRNDPAEVAELFRDALLGPFRGAFTRVVFAILDWSDDRHFIGPFQRAFTRLGD